MSQESREPRKEKSPNGCNRQGFESANQTSKVGKPMSSLALNVNNSSFAITMTSLELVDFINSQRKEDDALVRHADFMTKVSKVLGFEYSENFRSTYKASNGKENPCYRFPKRESCLMAMSYSYDLQAAVFDHMTNLEQQLIKTTIQAPKKPSELSSAFRSYMSIAKLCGLKGNQAILSADRATRKLTGESPLELLEITHLHAPVQEISLTPTQIGELLKTPVSARKVNILLESLDYQVKTGDQWLPTEKGKPFSEVLDTGKKHSDGTPVKQLKWYQSIVACLGMEKAA